MAHDHKFFKKNDGIFNKHSQVCSAAIPVIKALLRAGVAKINTRHFSESRGQRSITVSRTPTGLEVKTKGDGLTQTIFACTPNPDTVLQFLARKFRGVINIM